MSSVWEEVQVDELCELIVDCVNKTAPLSKLPTPFKMIRTPNIKDGLVNTEDCRTVEQETFDKWTRRADVKAGDVLLTREAPLGESGIVRGEEKLFLGQRIMQYRANNKKILPEFLNYAFLSPGLQHQFRMHEGSGSVVSHIRVGDCSKFKVPLPPIRTQHLIVDLLSRIDDKRLLNQKTNQTLEQIAQAIFKSWFVDFDPVIDNALEQGKPLPDALAKRAEQRKAVRAQQAKGELPSLPKDLRQRFPSEFVFSDELGWVPTGWKISSFKDIAEQIKINVKPNDLVHEANYVGLEHLDRKSLFLSRYESSEKITSNKSQFRKNDLLFGKLRPYFHKVCISDIEGICSTDILVFRSKKDSYKEYMYLTAFSDTFVKKMSAVSTGTRMPRAKAGDLLDYRLLLPAVEVIDIFSSHISPAFMKAALAIRESQTLSSLRDTLLPKLISGELRIPDAEILAADAGL